MVTFLLASTIFFGSWRPLSVFDYLISRLTELGKGPLSLRVCQQKLPNHLGNLSFPLMLPVAPLVLAVLETGAHYLSMAAAS